ncbi:hypothetical protein [Streptomyces parvulus]|uniref:hypothetical protein n=1 Tax=Streptomyces parvulus TaxID=146923 RepID=UPI0033AC30E7
MTKTAYIYVPAPSRRNLDIGLNKGLWGWRSATLDKATGRADVQSLQQGDFLVLAHIGPQARVPAGGWDTATLKRVVVTQITTPYFQDRTEVWPDDVYPERIGIDVLDEEVNITGQTLGSEAAEALRMSANKQGSALVIPGTAALAQFATELPADAADEEPGEAAPETISHNGADSALVQVLARREQAKLRKNMLNGASQKACALCGRTLPVRFIRAAHIKRRSAASREERLHMANIMPACLLGCDELFEHGYVYVTGSGTIAASGKADSTADLAQAAKALDGLTVADYTPQREPYFTWHRNNIAG